VTWPSRVHTVHVTYLLVTAMILRSAVDVQQQELPFASSRDPQDAGPAASPDVYNEFLPRIKQATDAVINITTGGGQGMSIDERLAAAERFSPEMTSLNMGSMNFGLYPMLARYGDLRHEWERKHLEGSKDFIFRNTFGDIEKYCSASTRGMARLNSSAMMWVISTRWRISWIATGKPPLFVQTIFGILAALRDAQMSS
jgi:uncharacterized protein (DUF849 family)